MAMEPRNEYEGGYIDNDENEGNEEKGEPGVANGPQSHGLLWQDRAENDERGDDAKASEQPPEESLVSLETNLKRRSFLNEFTASGVGMLETMAKELRESCNNEETHINPIKGPQQHKGGQDFEGADDGRDGHESRGKVRVRKDAETGRVQSGISSPQSAMPNTQPQLTVTEVEALRIVGNLREVECSLQTLVDDNDGGTTGGRYGSITREWGFATPNGLGPRLGGKFAPWEAKLDAVPSFFPPVEAYEFFQDNPMSQELPERYLTDPERQREKVNGHGPLHRFLMEAPEPAVEMNAEEDLEDFRVASRIFVLLGTLSHLAGNSATEPTELPPWIEEPLMIVADRLDVEPVLTGHFLTMENWKWRTSLAQELPQTQTQVQSGDGDKDVDEEEESGDRDEDVDEEKKNALATLCSVDVRDRTYRLRAYPRCFVARHAVDALVGAGHARSREDAVKLANSLNAKYRLFQHVTNDHEFVDEYLFFSFLTDDSDSFGGNDAGSDDKEEDYDNSTWRAVDIFNERVDEIANAMGDVTVKDRRYRLKVYRNCFLGRELIDLLVARGFCDTRKEAVRVGEHVNRKRRLFKHVAGEHELKDENLFYRFIRDDKEVATTTTVAAEIPSTSIASRSAEEEDGDEAMVISSSADEKDNDKEREFRIENIELLYSAFGGHDYERIYHLLPACMGYHMRTLPHLVLDVLSAMRCMLKAVQDQHDALEVDEYAQYLTDMLYDIASQLSLAKEQFQLMTSDQNSRTHLSKFVFIRQLQPLAKGVLVRRTKGGEPLPSNGMSGLHCPYFHLLDWLLGRYQDGGELGLTTKMAEVDKYYPKLLREYVLRLARLKRASTVRGFLDIVGRPRRVVTAFNHLLECYAGDGGVLQAYNRKLYSLLHNNFQIDMAAVGLISGAAKTLATGKDNHTTATVMFRILVSATEERSRLRVAPLMSQVQKTVHTTSETGGFATVSLSTGDVGLRYTYGDAAVVLLPNDRKDALAWTHCLRADVRGNEEGSCDKLMKPNHLPYNAGGGWSWKDLWEALGWPEEGVPLGEVAAYIEKAKVVVDNTGAVRSIDSPLDLVGTGDEKEFGPPPLISWKHVISLAPVSPRVYSVCGVDADRVFLLVSNPLDDGRHHGYCRMADRSIDTVHVSLSPATHFGVPPVNTNLVCVAAGTGISPFVGLAEAIGGRSGSYTIVHQCKSSDLFLCNSQQWLRFTEINPGATVLGYISGDGSQRNCPMRFVIKGGEFALTQLLTIYSGSAYYWESECLKNHLVQVHKPGGLNVAYCCGGIQSAIDPIKKIFLENGWTDYKFVTESYTVTPKLSGEKDDRMVGRSVVDLASVSPIHYGGDSILCQVQALALEEGTATKALPDDSKLFHELHPYSYNMQRTLRSTIDQDGDYKAYQNLLAKVQKRQAILSARLESRRQQLKHSKSSSAAS